MVYLTLDADPAVKVPAVVIKILITSLKKTEKLANQLAAKSKINDIKFNSIVCDPPYGIASTTGGERITDLMERCLEMLQKKMKKGQRLVIAVSEPDIVNNQNLRLIHKFEWYIHKSLTRNIMVLEKINI
mgnify:CR=1 FL=1